MSATEIDFDSEYRFYDENTKLNAYEFTRRFLSIHQRLVNVELKGQGYDSLIEQGIGAALKRINDGVQPLLETLVVNLTAAQTALDILQAQVSGGIIATDIRFQPGGTSLSAINVQDAIVELLSDVNAALDLSTQRQSQVSARDLYISGF